jgi:hypothetical protein
LADIGNGEKLMIRVAFLSNVVGAVYNRLAKSMVKFKPDYVDIVTIHGRYEIPILDKVDIVIGHLGAGSYNPHWAYISPKVVITEALDPVTLAHFTKKDLVVTYRQDRMKYIKEAGLNALLWARPKDTEIFYDDGGGHNKYDAVVSGNHNEWVQRVASVTKNIIVLGGGQTNYEQDYCWVGKGDDRLRYYYNVSKYMISLVTEYEYYPNFFNAGIESGNIEAALCGCRPLILDNLDYMKYWYSDFATFIRHDDFENHLGEILSAKYKPLSENVIRSVAARYNAKDVWSEFWEAVREVMKL